MSSFYIKVGYAKQESLNFETVETLKNFLFWNFDALIFLKSIESAMKLDGWKYPGISRVFLIFNSKIFRPIETSGYNKTCCSTNQSAMTVKLN